MLTKTNFITAGIYNEIDNSPANSTGGTYMNEDTTQPLIRNFKDTLFRKLFSDTENLLSLYNVMSGKHYTNPDLLTIVTLDNAIYMNMKLYSFNAYLTSC